MNAFCYVCNKQSSDCCQNFAAIKSQHTQTPVADFIKSFLADFDTIRNIDDEFNCICAECLMQIDHYDWTCQQAIEQEAKLRHLLLSTELTLKNVKNEPVEMKEENEDCHNERISVSGSRDLLSECGIKLEPDDEYDADETLACQQWPTSVVPSLTTIKPSTSYSMFITSAPAFQPNNTNAPVLFSEPKIKQKQFIIQQHQKPTSDGVPQNGKDIGGKTTKSIDTKAVPSSFDTTNKPLKLKLITPTTTSELKYPKPTYSYSCLIAMALKNSRTGTLPVTKIYDFLCAQFPYFRMAPIGWKSSVRHVLSTNKCYEKIEQDDEHPKCFWKVNPSKIAKMDEEILKCLRKEPTMNRKAMAGPENLSALLRGELKHGGLYGSFTELNKTGDSDPENDASNLIDELNGNGTQQPVVKRTRLNLDSIAKNL